MSQLFNNDDNKHSVWGFSSHGSSKYAINTKIMIAAVVVLFIVVLFILVLHIYARWFWRTARLGSRGRSWSRRLRRRRMRFDFVTAESAAAAGTNNITNKGLDKAVMEALPVFFYTKKGKVVDSDEQPADEDDVLECAVCLSEFEENEAGRRLPKCSHVFHTECIDMWFSSHSTCPLCRTSVVMATSDGDPLQQPTLESGALGQDSRSQGERILHETVVSGLLGSSSHHANGNAMAIQILQDEGAVLLTGHQQDHYIVNIGSSSSSSRQQQQQQFPANVLFWGNQAYMSSHNLLSPTTQLEQQDKVTSSSSNSGNSNRKLNSFKQQHLVIEVPRRSSGNFSSACSSQYPSPTTTEGGQKSPLGAHLRNIRRLLSRDSRRSSVDASPVGDCCEQLQLNSACNTPGSVSGCQTPTSQH